MDQMLPLPSQELPTPNRVESNPQSGSEVYEIPIPEIGKHNSRESVSQAVAAVAQAADDISTVVTDGDQNSSIPAPVDDNSVTTNPIVAKDDNLIEKEWVHGAKKIVQETRHDPQQQATKISRFKSDYIKKRFGKDIKLSEESSL